MELPTFLEELLYWWPIIWTARIALLIFLVAAGWSAFLYCLKLIRWRNIRAMWDARLPRLKRVGGNVAGNEFAVDLDQDEAERVEGIAGRLDEVAARQAIDREAISRLYRYLERKEAQHEERSHPGRPPGDPGGDADSRRD